MSGKLHEPCICGAEKSKEQDIETEKKMRVVMNGQRKPAVSKRDTLIGNLLVLRYVNVRNC